MEVRKNPHIDLEHYQSVFFGIGLTLSLLIIISVFELKFYDNLETIELVGTSDALVVEQIEIPNTEQPPPPPPPKTILEQPEIIEVKNEEEIRQDIEINLDVEISEESVAQTSIFGEGSAETPPPVPPPPPVVEKEEEIFIAVEERPEPVGGFEAFYAFVGEKTQYPKAAQINNIEGRVFVQFIVDKDGSLTDLIVVKGVGFGLDEEALRVLSMAPKWTPGKQRGRPVKVKMTMPLLFKIVN